MFMDAFNLYPLQKSSTGRIHLKWRGGLDLLIPFQTVNWVPKVA